LLLPADLLGQLDPAQTAAIIAHELCHWRRRDNLTACLHMVVEVLFWFHPLVWWLGARLIVERERACDEAVIEIGGNRQTYAEGILKVCQFHVSRPLLCVPGASGGDLKKRITFIMENENMATMNVAKKFLLAGIGAAAVAGPLALGLTVAAPVQADGTAPYFKAVIVPNSCSMPQYPQAAKEAKLAGSVTFDFLVGADGVVKNSKIALSSGSTLLDDAALTALSKCRFGPAEGAGNGGQVEGWTKIKYTWKLG
jgi:TonB family protein